MYKFKDIIEEVEERNTDLRYGLDDIVGVTIEKGLIPTVANLAQTSLEKFYIVKPETFVYNPRTHGVRLGMGFNNTTNIYITSWNNVAFRIKKEAQNIVIPYYLWLFFCRPIWDRLTNFLAWGSSTIVFAWKDFLNIDIVLPSIEYQREIVSEYETLSNRIRLNNQMIQNLEATAQALYRKTFVENIDKENLPEGWRMGTIGEFCEIKYGKAHEGIPDGSIPIYGSGGIMRFGNKSIYSNESVLIPRKGSLNNITFVDSPFWTVDTMFYTEMKLSCVAKYVYFNLKQYNFMSMDAGSAVPSMTTAILNQIELIIPTLDVLEQFDKQESVLFNQIKIKNQENDKLTELQSLLLAKMGQ